MAFFLRQTPSWKTLEEMRNSCIHGFTASPASTYRSLIPCAACEYSPRTLFESVTTWTFRLVCKRDEHPSRANLTWDLTPCVGHAESRKVGGGSEMIHHDGKEKLP